MKRATGFPSRNPITVGMPWTPNRPASSGLASTSTFANSQRPPDSAARRSRIGPNTLHGPHQAAQKSTTTGTVRDRAITSSSKRWVVTSFTFMTRRVPPARRLTVEVFSAGVDKGANR